MKKLFVILVVVLWQNVIIAQSPVGKGSFTFGGSISYSSQSYEKLADNTTVFTFNPQAGYFFVDNFYTAISINYEHYSNGSSNSTRLGIGPTIRYYFDLENIKPFAGLSYSYNEQRYSSINDKLKSTEFKLTGGINFFVTSYFALETSINYSFINYSLPSGMYYYDRSKSNIFQVAVGANYFIF